MERTEILSGGRRQTGAAASLILVHDPLCAASPEFSACCACLKVRVTLGLSSLLRGKGGAIHIFPEQKT